MDSSMTFMHNKVKLCSTTIPEDEGQSFFTQQKKKEWARWKPYDEEARNDLKNTVMYQKGEARNDKKKTRTEVTVRERAARSSRPIESKVLKQQARKAMAEHAVKCSLMPSKGIPKERPLAEHYVNGSFTEHRGAWEKDLQRHSVEVHADPEDTHEEQEQIIIKYKTDDDRHFTEDGRVAEITIDLMLQAWAKMSGNKVNGREDSIVIEMIKQLPQEKTTKLQDTFEIGSWSWKMLPGPGRL